MLQSTDLEKFIRSSPEFMAIIKSRAEAERLEEINAKHMLISNVAGIEDKIEKLKQEQKKRLESLDAARHKFEEARRNAFDIDCQIGELSSKMNSLHHTLRNKHGEMYADNAVSRIDMHLHNIERRRDDLEYTIKKPVHIANGYSRFIDRSGLIEELNEIKANIQEVKEALLAAKQLQGADLTAEEIKQQAEAIMAMVFQ